MLIHCFKSCHVGLQAMREEVDLSSPFTSPRTGKENRRLVRRTAYMMGSTEVGGKILSYLHERRARHKPNSIQMQV